MSFLFLNLRSKKAIKSGVIILILPKNTRLIFSFKTKKTVSEHQTVTLAVIVTVELFNTIWTSSITHTQHIAKRWGSM